MLDDIKFMRDDISAIRSDVQGIIRWQGEAMSMLNQLVENQKKIDKKHSKLENEINKLNVFKAKMTAYGGIAGTIAAILIQMLITVLTKLK